MPKAMERSDFGRTLSTKRIRTTIAIINRMKATIERPAGADGQPVQNKLNDPVAAHPGVLNEITQNRAAIVVITAVIRSNIFSVICMILVRRSYFYITINSNISESPSF